MGCAKAAGTAERQFSANFESLLFAPAFCKIQKWGAQLLGVASACGAYTLRGGYSVVTDKG
eukprot:668936-Amphidinium_carterae.1